MLNLKIFQEEVCTGIVARFENVRSLYNGMRQMPPAALDEARQRDGAVVLQAVRLTVVAPVELALHAARPAGAAPGLPSSGTSMPLASRR